MGFFSPTAGSAVSLKNTGDTFTGKITGALSERQATYQGQLRVTKKGNPVMEILVPLTDMQTGHESILYVSKWRMKRAIQDAVKVSGAGDLEYGGILTVSHTGKENTTEGGQADTFSAQYIPADQASSMQAPAPQAPAAPQAAPQAPAQQQYSQPVQQQGGYQPAPNDGPYQQANYGQPMQQGGYSQPAPMGNAAPTGYAQPQYSNAGPAPLTN